MIAKMTAFPTWDSYDRFARSVKHSSRYVLDDEATQFLAAAVASSQHRRKIFPSQRILWRAQRGHAWVSIDDTSDAEVPGPHEANRMTPLRHCAREGRVNPKGIPCLYLNDHRDTAMAEVRPWLSEAISVAQFRTVRPLTLIDCRSEVSASSRIDWLFSPPPQEQFESVAWDSIGQAFSTPVTTDDSTADYSPTQIIAEALRKVGFDGIVYQSMLGPGANIALFDIHAAELLNCFLFQPKRIEFEFEEIANPYYRMKIVPQQP